MTLEFHMRFLWSIEHFTSQQADRSWFRFAMGLLEFFIDIFLGRTTAVGSTLPPTEMVIRGISW